VALEYYIKLCKTGLTDTQRRLEDAFLDDKVGFVISGDWLLKRIENEKPDFAFTAQLIPPPKIGDSSVSFAGGEYLAVNSRSAQADIAYELIRYICSPKNQLRFCLQNRTPTPSSVDAAADSTLLAQPHFDVFIEQLKTSRTSPATPQWVYIEEQLERAIEKALYGTKTAGRALGDATREIEELLAQ
jgi:maltose-binding protein MalE